MSKLFNISKILWKKLFINFWILDYQTIVLKILKFDYILTTIFYLKNKKIEKIVFVKVISLS